MTFYAIMNRSQPDKDGCDLSLQKACAAKGIRYERLVAEDITLDDLTDMQFEQGSLLYRLGLGSKAAAIESVLANLHADKLTTIYYPRTFINPVDTLRGMLVQMASGLDIVPTRIVDETWKTMSDAELTRRVDPIGGFPIIIKMLGKSHGQGVMKIDDVAALRARLDDESFDKYRTIARKYLADYRHLRLIVIDNKVAAALEYHKPEDDFRTNLTNDPIVTPLDHTKLESGIVSLALEGVKIRSSILGGVDILLDVTDNRPYLAEVNVPCYFARAEAPTGIDVGGALVEALIRKQEAA